MRPALPFALAAAAITASGCGGTTAASAPREPDAYEGCASDENWIAFDDTERAGAGTDPAAAPLFTVPTEGAALDGAMPARFAWQPTPSAAGHAFGDSSCAQCSVCGQHLPPIAGTAYDLQILDGGAVAWRVLTTLQRFTPPEARWAEWRGRTLELRAFRLPLDENVPTEGAHAAAPIHFSVGR